MKAKLTFLAAIVLGLAPLNLRAGAEAEESKTLTFPVSGAPEVIVSAGDAAVSIRGWDKQVVELRYSKQVRGPDDAEAKRLLEAIEINARQSGNTVNIEERERTHVPWRNRHVRVELNLSVPRNSNLSARTGDGAVALEDVQGTLAVHTGDGNVRAARLQGDIQLHSGDGKMDLEDLSGKLEARAGDGDIRGSQLVGNLTLHTGDGDIRLDAATGSVTLSTGDGNIEAGGQFSALRARTQDGRLTIHALGGKPLEEGMELESGDGSIELRLPATLAATLSLSTGDGHIETRLPLEILGTFSPHHVEGKINGGGPTLRLRTGDGNIRIVGE